MTRKVTEKGKMPKDRFRRLIGAGISAVALSVSAPAAHAIVGGKVAVAGERPWHAEVFFGNTKQGFIAKCGGALVAADWVLTNSIRVDSPWDTGSLLLLHDNVDIPSERFRSMANEPGV